MVGPVTSLHEQVVKVGIAVDPSLQFVVRRLGRGVGAVHLREFCTAVHTDLKG